MKGQLALLFWLVPALAFAFPELVRHGYQRCDTCHTSPDGGGALTAYGRALSKEILSTWGGEEESKFAYGIVTPNDWLALGGDFRFVQTHTVTEAARFGRPVVMQLDFGGGAKVGQFTFDGTFGVYGSAITSRRHFVQWKPDDHWSVRAGRFLKSFGVHLPDHYVEIRRGLGWDQGAETYNVEGAYFTDGGEVFVTGQIGRPDRPALNAEKGAAVRAALNLGDRYKVGASYFYGTRTGMSRHVTGPYAILGFSTHLFLLAELDLQISKTGASSATGAATFLRLGWEPVMGLIPFIQHEYSQADFRRGGGRKLLYSAGLQWFPRPHFELLGAYQRQILSAASGGDADFVWLMGHFYF